jgi:uncharacterized protein with von Willebrand factor type A (vWA) domain
MSRTCTCSSNWCSCIAGRAEGWAAVLVQFFFELRSAGVPLSTTEFLMLLEALQARVAQLSAQDFYYLARACLVKDERHYDRFDRVFAEVFAGAERLSAQLLAEVPRALGAITRRPHVLGSREAPHRVPRRLGQTARDTA